MPNLRLPLATSFLNRDSTVNKDSKIVNGFVEHYSQDQTAVVKRPGLSLYANGGGCGQGLVKFNNELFVTSGNTTSTIGGTPVVIGKIWTEANATAFPYGITYAPLIEFNNKLWYLGGLTSTLAVVNDVYNSVDGFTWTKLTVTTPFTARYYHSAFVLNNKLWIVGGFNGASTLGDIWNTSDGITWTQVVPAASFSARSVFNQVISFNGYLYLLGGHDGVNYLNDVWKSLDGLTWSLVSTTGIWSIRGEFSPVVYNGELYVIGGRLIDQAGVITAEIYKTSDGATWSLVTASPGFSARLGAAIYNYNLALFIVGGSHDGSSSLADVWTSINGSTWTQVTSNTDYGARTHQGYEIFNGAMWQAGGGIVGGSRLPSVWYSGGARDISASCEMISFSQTGSAVGSSKLMLKSSTAAFLYDPVTLLTTQITDPDYPATTVPGIVFLDGYFFVMTPDGVIYNSNLEDPTNWNALDYITAEMEPDGGVAIAKHLNYLVAFGEKTTEFFYDAANAAPGSPLSRVDNAFMFYGCAAGNSVVHMNNTLVWMCQTQQFGRQVAVMNGFAPQIISTPFVERILAADDLATVYAFNTKVLGHDFYVLTLKTSNITLVFDFTSKLWYQWTSMRAQIAKSITSIALGTDGVTATVTLAGHGYADGDLITIAGAVQTAYNGSFNITYIDTNSFSYIVSGTPVSPATGTITATGYTEGYFSGVASTNDNNLNLLQDETTGNILQVSQSFTTDDSIYINFKVRSVNFDAGNMETKFLSRLEIIGDKEPGSHLLIRYSNDDYVTYSTYRKVDLNSSRSRLNRLGSFKRRAFEFRHTDSTSLRLEDVELRIDKEGM